MDLCEGPSYLGINELKQRKKVTVSSTNSICGWQQGIRKWLEKECLHENLGEVFQGDIQLWVCMQIDRIQINCVLEGLK